MICMTGKQFIAWMKVRKLRVPDVAARTGLSSNTIYAFRRDESVHHLTRKEIMDFVATYDVLLAKAEVRYALHG